MPPGIEIDDYNSEGDICFLEELRSSDSPPLPENESFSLDHFDDPSLPRPPPEPPDVEICFNLEPDAGDFINKVVGDISEHDVVKRIENEAKMVRCTVAVRGGRHVSTRYCSGGGWTNQSMTRGTGVCQSEECPKNTGAGEKKTVKKPSQTSRGVPVGPKIGFKPQKEYQPVLKKPTISSSDNKKKV
ncbi:hypothetical protein Tco_1301274 [Tanacetum coccineum]